MEIERKYLVSQEQLPTNYTTYPNHYIEQGYLCKEPVVRVRRQDCTYYLTYKSKGLLSREESNLPLTAKSYAHLIKKSDGVLITKTRYLIPYLTYTIELDIFHGSHSGLLYAEVEFPSESEANSFTPPSWFGKDVTYEPAYQNCNLIDKFHIDDGC